MDSSKIWELADKTGGIFKLTVLLQKRVQELIRGAPRLVEIDTYDVLAIALKEVQEGKISLEKLTAEELEAGAQEFQDEMAAERTILGDGKKANKTELP
ncbi:MAG: DNA-directed RNA polymerase subunit omega [Planctomycetota bacterium]|jgi:DNA-directed RNA polymerase subunit K/omega